MSSPCWRSVSRNWRKSWYGMSVSRLVLTSTIERDKNPPRCNGEPYLVMPLSRSGSNMRRHWGGRQMIRFVWVLALSLVTLPFASQQGGAQQGWPDKPIRVIVPLPAGSAVDVVGRLIMGKLGERLGQIMVVENRAGASGALASDAIAKAAPDGYTLGMATSTTHVTTAILNAKLPYDPVKDFAPVALIGLVPFTLAVAPKLPANNLKELLALAKAKPKTLSYSSVGNAAKRISRPS